MPKVKGKETKKEERQISHSLTMDHDTGCSCHIFICGTKLYHVDSRVCGDAGQWFTIP